MLIVFLVYTPVYFFRKKVWRGESLFFRERLGLRLPSRRESGSSLWIHAVSVGEVLSLRNLLSQIKARHPDWTVYFSTLTHSGYRIAREKLPEADRIFLIPLDFAWIVRRYFRSLRPQVFVLAESEFWPNLLRAAHRECRAVLLINGRMSARSFRQYRRWKALSLRVLGNIDRFLVQTEQDRARLAAVGVPPEKLQVAGNLKAEVSLPTYSAVEMQSLKQKLGIREGQKIIVAGSTHRGEEDVILKAYQVACQEAHDLVLLIAPRHPQRSEEVEKAASAVGFTVWRKTKQTPGKTWQVLIIDTIGELPAYYAIADLAFIGGSLVPHGGQNLLEPAFYGKPIIFGPHMENFASLADEFLRRGAARVVKGADDLAEALAGRSELGLQNIGKRAREVLDSLQGATELTVLEIEKFFLRTGQ